VDFPLENFYPYKSSGRVGSTNCDVRYDLVASIYRDAKTQHIGHFYAVCKDDTSGVWHKYDDDELTLTSLQKYIRTAPTIKKEYQRRIDLLVYVQQDPPIYMDDTSSQFSGLGTTIQQVDSNSSGKMSSVTGVDYDSNNNSREESHTVCNQSNMANIHV
jgi:hypothetical protein